VAYSEKSRGKKEDHTVRTVLKFNIKHCSLTLIFIPNCKILLMCPSELIIIKMTLYLMIYITVVVSRIFTY
jgi:hypothetical protein